MKTGFSPSSCFEKSPPKGCLPLFIVTVADFPEWLRSAPEPLRKWLEARKFSAKAGACALLPSVAGAEGAVVTVSDPTCLWDYASLAKSLPSGTYDAEPDLTTEVATAFSLGFALGSYQYTRYKKKSRKLATMVWPPRADKKTVLAIAEGIFLARDLVNTPASDMGPEELADVAAHLAKKHEAVCKLIVGDALLKKNYPMIHAVGRASMREPRLIDLTWGKNKHPKVSLVGKGVCFDTGGLDIKPPPYMKLMKKDMGGAALVLGLAHTIMSLELPIRLRLLIPAVENSVSGNAMRPLDVLSSRKGLSVEVGDTDAEGRLVLGDALFEADSEGPDLLIDAATLTGAARVALGTAMPAIFGTQETTWAALERASEKTHDPLWRLPLHAAYRSKLDSKIADISNIGNDGYAGAIIAALFLQEFVSKDQDWVHMDTMGYNVDGRPGRPVGGEALGLMALFELLLDRYGTKRKTPNDDPEELDAPETEAESEAEESHLEDAALRPAPQLRGTAKARNRASLSKGARRRTIAKKRPSKPS